MLSAKGAILVIVAELCAIGAGQLLTVCVHEDGSIRYEPSMALCCKPNDRGQGECCTHEEGVPSDDHAVSPEDSCEDFSLVFSQVLRPTPSIKQFLPDGFEPCEILPALNVAADTSASASKTLSEFSGPPRNHTLQDLSTIVLRL